jgi:fructokinase
MIVCCGEALMDLVPTYADDGALSFRPVLGGSFFNIALGLGRLGTPAAYLWELADDTFGRVFKAALTEAGVRFDLLAVSRRATPVAVVDLSGAEPRYSIADPDEVMRTCTPAPDSWPADMKVLLTGSAILALEPVGSRIEAMIAELPDDVLLALDYNVRPPAVRDLAAYRARLERLDRRAAIVKASKADLQFLYGEIGIEAHLERFRAAGVSLAVITLGARGAVARTPAAQRWVTAPAIEVADVVGAGDGFTVGLVSALAERHLLSRSYLNQLPQNRLDEMLAQAQEVAASVCRSVGARMPWRSELARNCEIVNEPVRIS